MLNNIIISIIILNFIILIKLFRELRSLIIYFFLSIIPNRVSATH